MTFNPQHSGDSYFYNLVFDDIQHCYVDVSVLSKYSYDLLYERTYADIGSQEKTIEYEKELPDGSTMICYNKKIIEGSSNRYTVVKYILSN